jgi:hypothetical protein
VARRKTRAETTFGEKKGLATIKMQSGASAFTAARSNVSLEASYGGWPAWPWPLWVADSPAFLYYDGTAYPSSMDRCMEAQLPVCMDKTASAFSHCTSVVFERCKNESLQIASVYVPYPGG